MKGPNRGIPVVRAMEQSRVASATLDFTMNDLIQQYRRSGRVINDDFSNLYPFENNILNEQLLIRLAEFDPLFEIVYNRMPVNDSDRVYYYFTLLFIYTYII